METVKSFAGECELTLAIARIAFQRATDQTLPIDAWHGRRYPNLGGNFWFELFEDSALLSEKLPRLSAQYA